LATVPNFKIKLLRLLAATRDYSDNSSNDNNFPSLSKLLPKQRGNSVAAKLSLKSISENTVGYALDRKPAIPFEPRAGSSQG